MRGISKSALRDSPVLHPIHPLYPYLTCPTCTQLIKPGFGVSESGAEFGETNIPGKLDKDYTWPNTTAIQTLRDDGMNIFRVPFLMERLVPSEMTGSLDQAYLKGLKKVFPILPGSIWENRANCCSDCCVYNGERGVCGAGSAQLWTIVRSHPWSGGLVSTGTDDNSSGNIISSTDNFQAFWKTVAGEFASNNKVIFDTSKPSSPVQPSPNPRPSLSANRTCCTTTDTDTDTTRQRIPRHAADPRPNPQPSRHQRNPGIWRQNPAHLHRRQLVHGCVEMDHRKRQPEDPNRPVRQPRLRNAPVSRLGRVRDSGGVREREHRPRAHAEGHAVAEDEW